MDIATLISEANKGAYKPVHVLIGSERFLVDRAVAALRRASVGEPDGLNEQTFEGRSLNAERVIDAARTLPMLATARFILVRGAEAAPAPELDRLAGYFDHPADSSCLVIVADKLDGRMRFVQRAKKTGILTNAAPLKPAEVRRFAVAEAKRRGHALDAAAVAALVDATGNDLPAIDDALERCSLYVGRGQPIDEQVIEACVTRVRVESIWALVDAVSARDRRRAMTTAASLLADREPPLRILALVTRQLRMLARMRAALASGKRPPEAAQLAGAPPFKARELATSARRFAPEDLTRAFTIVADTDMALKGESRCPPEDVLQGAILSLCSQR